MVQILVLIKVCDKGSYGPEYIASKDGQTNEPIPVSWILYHDFLKLYITQK